MHVGGVQIGGGAPVVVQSMTCTDTADAQATLAQVCALAQAGCDIVRVSVPTEAALEGFRTICAESPVPIVADIHFNHKLAIGAVEAGAAKLRINPGNIGDWAKVDAVIDAAGAAGCAIRIGVNAGSLEQDIAERDELTQPEKLVMSSERFVKHFEDRGFTNIVLSAKAHSVQTTLDTYRALSREISHVPLHLGVTEAGTKLQGTIKSSVGLGILLSEGIGDTMRAVSYTHLRVAALDTRLGGNRTLVNLTDHVGIHRHGDTRNRVDAHKQQKARQDIDENAREQHKGALEKTLAQIGMRTLLRKELGFAARQLPHIALGSRMLSIETAAVKGGVTRRISWQRLILGGIVARRGLLPFLIPRRDRAPTQEQGACLEHNLLG